ncbi:hypothetical protein H4Q26_000910 [Puccinia striiformis f. sp. tritici PST-130]|nr:hypothetical protein H4Q26_000910 [Puccinia striiformis f. sp. tritici PST-130]
MTSTRNDNDGLLSFQEEILKELNEKDGLLILARGLGLRSIISSFLKPHCIRNQATNSLVFVINATTDDEAGINDQLGMRMACIGHEITGSERERIFKHGGVLSITSRILIVDLLNSKLDISQITGIVILHAEENHPCSKFTKETAAGPRQNESPWLFTSAADTIFSVAKNRVYIKSQQDTKKQGANEISILATGGPSVEEEEAMREIEELTLNAAERAGHNVSGFTISSDTWGWLPKGIQPVLENQPKWHLLEEVLKEIEVNLYQAAESETVDSHESNAILVMCSSASTCSVLKEYLATQHSPSDPSMGQDQ